ncbi:hypothetical protein, partial [Neptunomonas phycophila]|uniref:hypothetical protein n=1 Tax=Neptunomonas phycophila TaxID=1572645 RepID=UPI000B2D4CEF
NGWHPHFHILIFSKSPLPSTNFKGKKRSVVLHEQSDEWIWILERWKSICVRVGLSSPNEFGLDIQDGSQAGEYISKFGGD